MDVAALLHRLGGVATRAELLAAAPRADVDRALRDRELVVVAHGRYALPGLSEARGRAARLGGVLSLTSAALQHGWAVKTVPDLPHVLVPTKRKVLAAARHGVHLHRGDLAPDDHTGGVTSKELTLLQCARSLPFDEALAVADSACRAGDGHLLARVAQGVRGPGSPQVRRVVSEASPLAANPFESTLRAIALDISGLRVRPQVRIRCGGVSMHPDLVDVDLAVVVEADSFEWHGDRDALRSDARRYNLMVAAGWLVLRFTWEDVMFEPDWVRRILEDVVSRRRQVPPSGIPSS